MSNVFPATVVASEGTQRKVMTHRGMPMKALGVANVGEPVAVSMRPERLRLSRREVPATEPSALSGVLAHARYLGLSTQYVVETGEGHAIIVTMLNDEPGVELFAPGTPVQIESVSRCHGS